MAECLPFFFTGKVSKLTSGRLGMGRPNKLMIAYKHGLALGLFELSGKECRRNWDDTKMMVALSRSCRVLGRKHPLGVWEKIAWV